MSLNTYLTMEVIICYNLSSANLPTNFNFIAALWIDDGLLTALNKNTASFLQNLIIKP